MRQFTWQTGRTPIRYFAVLSFVVIGLTTTALVLLISHYVRKNVLDRERTVTADFVRIQAAEQLKPMDFAASGGRDAQSRFQAFYKEIARLPEVVRIKVYDTAATIVWSDDPTIVGRQFPGAHLSRALAGDTVINVDTVETSEPHLREDLQHLRLIEVYVPLFDPNSTRVVGVVEAYKQPKAIMAGIRNAQVAVVTTAIAGGVLLYLALFWIVLRAARRIDEQRQSMEKRSRELASALQELQAVQSQLVATERMAAIGEVVTAVAHSIRNPLANIRASAQVVSLDCSDPAAAESLADIMAEVDRLEGRLRELLRFVRPADQPTSAIDLNSIIAGVLKMTSTQLDKLRIRLQQDLAPFLPPVRGNPMLLEQVFLSLVGNAVDAMSTTGGILTVRTGRSAALAASEPGPALSGGVFCEIQDTGCGIEPEQFARIFEPFHTTKAQGTGLGLSIAKKFTEVHGGTLTAHSTPGAGATFRVTLPDNGGGGA